MSAVHCYSKELNYACMFPFIVQLQLSLSYNVEPFDDNYALSSSFEYVASKKPKLSFRKDKSNRKSFDSIVQRLMVCCEVNSTTIKYNIYDILCLHQREHTHSHSNSQTTVMCIQILAKYRQQMDKCIVYHGGILYWQKAMNYIR